MLRKASLGIICLVISFSSYGQISKHLAPVNPELIEFQNTNKNKKKSASLQVTGYKPPYYQLPEYFNQNQTKSALVPTLPEKFDLRAVQGKYNYVSKVKNQGTGQNGGNCWAFSSLGSMESVWMWGKGLKEADLSEQNLASCHGYGWKYGDGGNEYLVIGYLSRLKGPISEADSEYDPNGDISCHDEYSPVAYAPDTRWIYNNPVLVKKMILDYGPVSTNIHWDDVYYKNDKHTFSSDSRQGPNHAIQLVGWDDTKVTQSGTGAWIAKNSWGTGWGENGFFYISYRDKHILKPASFYPERWDTSYVDTVFYYDEIGTVTFMGFDNDTAYTLSKFHTNKPRLIREVGTFVAHTGSIITVQIYQEFKDGNLSKLLGEVTSEPAVSPGFYTFNVPAKIDGDFYVKIKYITPGFGYPVPIEMFAEVNGEIYAKPNIELSGKQWYSKNGAEWKPLGSDIKGDSADLVVNVYATDNESAMSQIAANKYEVCNGSEIEFSVIDTSTTNTYSWDFGGFATPLKATGKGPHKVKIDSKSLYLQEIGYAIQYAKLYINGKDSILKEYKIVEALNVQIGSADFTKVNEPINVSAICDADKFKWYPEKDFVSADKQTVTFKSDVPGLHKVTVTASQGNCITSWSTNIEVKSPPINDKTCNAIILKMGDNGPYTNDGATADYKEVAPADTSCYDDKTWCDEGGIQNSVWFKVAGPDNGKLSIDTRGMDTQIALYESSDCNSIKKEDLIAANDDYYTSAPYAAAFDTVKVVPGKIYYLQVDGSAGGATGTFYITVGNVAVDQIERDSLSQASKSTLAVYPNPNFGKMTVSYESEKSENVQLMISDLTGRIVFQNRYLVEQGLQHIPLNLSSIKKGIYYVSLKSDSNAEITKCIIK